MGISKSNALKYGLSKNNLMMNEKMAHKMQGKMGQSNLGGVPFVCFPLEMDSNLMAQKMSGKMGQKMMKQKMSGKMMKQKMSGKMGQKMMKQKMSGKIIKKKKRTKKKKLVSKKKIVFSFFLLYLNFSNNYRKISF